MKYFQLSVVEFVWQNWKSCDKKSLWQRHDTFAVLKYLTLQKEILGLKVLKIDQSMIETL